MRASVHRFTMRDPGDVSELAVAISAGKVNPAHIVAVLGKTEGNGLVNDFTRGYLTQSLKLLLAEKLGQSMDAIGEKVIFVFSGGTEGVLTPHYVVFSVDPAAQPIAQTPTGKKTLAVGTAFTPVLAPEDLGRIAHVNSVAQAVRAAMAQAKITDPADVHFVQVKGPCVTTERAAEAKARGAQLVTTDPNKSMAYTRVAGAFGVAAALGELPPGQIREDAFFSRLDWFSERASISSGVEVAVNEVMVLGNSAAWNSDYVIAHRPMTDALDINAIYACLADLGIAALGDNTATGLRQIAAAMIKCEPDASGYVRGQRHTMWQDGDINAQRHIRGAVGGLVAGVIADTRIFVSGGDEHQGPPGGGMIALVAKAA
ncbi:MAG: ring-opening amidohydrolase [Betaproteobacteria bacterium]|nr:ring-opening amidohydrolase [Betaproteobacteria bacterium]